MGADLECTEWQPSNERVALLKKSAASSADVNVDGIIRRDERGDQTSVVVAVCTLLVSVPALIGMWCWPALVIPLLGGTVTSASRHTSHYINLGIDLVMLAGVTAYIWYEGCTKRQRRASATSFSSSSTIATTASSFNPPKSHQKYLIVYGPAYLVSVASLLILADPIRHVLQDLHLIGASMYISGCPIRALQIPSKSCSVPEDCGSHHCGGAYYSVNPGEDCFTCWNDSMCSEGAETFGCLSTVGWIVTVVCTYVGFSCFFVGVLWNSKLIPKILRQWSAIRANAV